MSQEFDPLVPQRAPMLPRLHRQENRFLLFVEYSEAQLELASGLLDVQERCRPWVLMGTA
jgi:hypothetical protein